VLFGSESVSPGAGTAALPVATMALTQNVRACIWCLLFVLIGQGLRGSGPQRLIRALGEEAGNLIMTFHRPRFFPSTERAPHHTTTENPLLSGDPSPQLCRWLLPRERDVYY